MGIWLRQSCLGGIQEELLNPIGPGDLDPGKSPGGKIIENILFGAAFARKVFKPYTSGTQ